MSPYLSCIHTPCQFRGSHPFPFGCFFSDFLSPGAARGKRKSPPMGGGPQVRCGGGRDRAIRNYHSGSSSFNTWVHLFDTKAFVLSLFICTSFSLPPDILLTSFAACVTHVPSYVATGVVSLRWPPHLLNGRPCSAVEAVRRMTFPRKHTHAEVLWVRKPPHRSRKHVFLVASWT